MTTRRGPGRPPLPGSKDRHTVAVKLDPEHWVKLQAIADSACSKPGPLTTERVIEWIESFDFAQLGPRPVQEEAFRVAS
jgi:hypothetical protein